MLHDLSHQQRSDKCRRVPREHQHTRADVQTGDESPVPSDGECRADHDEWSADATNQIASHGNQYCSEIRGQTSRTDSRGYRDRRSRLGIRQWYRALDALVAVCRFYDREVSAPRGMGRCAGCGWPLRLVRHDASKCPPALDPALSAQLLGLAVAAVSGLCEEAIFRKLLMDDLGRQGFSVALQALASAVAFGAAHAVWGLFRGSLRAASGAMTATGILGVLLAIVYVVSGRNLAPCVVAHFTINALIEPGLVVAAVRGEMGRAA